MSEIERLVELSDRCGHGEGEWRGGVAGNCNLVAYNGEDVVGIAIVPYGPRIEFIAALVNWFRANHQSLESVRSEAWNAALEEALTDLCSIVQYAINRLDADKSQPQVSGDLAVQLALARRALSPARVAEGERSDHDVVGEHLHSTELRK